MTKFKNGFTMQEHQEYLLPRLMEILGGDDTTPLMNVLTDIKLDSKTPNAYNFAVSLIETLNHEITSLKQKRILE